MKALTFDIDLLSPVLVSQVRGGDENSSVSFNFIPGSTIRGAIINRYLRHHALDAPSQDSTFRRLFLDGKVRYLNAYPLSSNGQRTLPRPKSWRKEKSTSYHGMVYDFVIQEPSIERPVEPKWSFTWRVSEYIEAIEPHLYFNIHNFNKDRNVRGKADESLLYRYEALAPGQRFGAVIIADDEEDLKVIHDLICENKDFVLGGSRSAGYGRVSFERLSMHSMWKEYIAGPENDSKVIITLLSDAILKDNSGQAALDIDSVIGASHKMAYRRTRVVGGFNRTWGLPIVQAIAIEAGSVFVYDAHKVDKELLLELLEQGIGHRRAEGFGRIAVNWQGEPEFKSELIGSPSISKGSSQLSKSDESHNLAQVMADRRLRSTLDKKLLESLSILSIQDPTSKTQLSRLRVVARKAWREKKLELITRYIEELKGDSKTALQNTKVNGEDFSVWLQQGIEGDDIWSRYFKPGRDVCMAGVKARITNELKMEYMVRLIDGLLQRTIREMG